MKLTIYWATKDIDKIKMIREKFNIPTYTLVNRETTCNVKDEDLPLLRETEKRGFIQIRIKKP